jgi:carbamoyl-phosphate synthase large subunit
MSKQTVRVLMTCIGGFFGLDFIRAIKMDADMPVHLTGVDANPHVVSRHYVDSFHSIQSHPDQIDKYVDELLAICERDQVQVVLPSADEEVLAVSARLQDFHDKGIQCSVEPYETVQMLRDKVKVFDHLTNTGISLPHYKAIQSIEDVREFAELVGYPDDPLILKPATGRGARGLFLVDSSVKTLDTGTEARGYETGSLDVFEQIVQKQPEVLEGLMGMEFLQGNVHDVDCLSDHGTPVSILVRERLTHSQFSRGVEGHEIIENEAMKQFVTQAVKVLNFNYCNDFDFLITKDGKPGLIEINPRWSGSVVAGVAAGVNYPNMLIRKLLNLPLPNVTIQTGLKSYPVHRLLTPGVTNIM